MKTPGPILRCYYALFYTLGSKTLLWVVVPNLFIQLFFLLVVGRIIGSNYTAYVAPGLITLTVFSYSMGVATDAIIDRFVSAGKFYQYYISFDGSSSANLLSFYVFPRLVVTLVSLIPVFAIIFESAGALGLLLAVASSAIAFLGFCVVSVKLAASVESFQSLTWVRMMTLVLVTFSSLIVPPDFLTRAFPAPVVVVMELNPLSLTATAIRMILRLA